MIELLVLISMYGDVVALEEPVQVEYVNESFMCNIPKKAYGCFIYPQRKILIYDGADYNYKRLALWHEMYHVKEFDDYGFSRGVHTLEMQKRERRLREILGIQQHVYTVN